MSIEETTQWQADGPVVYAELGGNKFEIVCYMMLESRRRPIEESMREEMALAQEVVAAHNRASALDATLARAQTAPAWALKGRDGEPVTLLEKLEQAMEFGSAMEKLAIENNARAQTAEAALAEAKAALGDLAQKLKLPSSRALVREALARIEEKS